MESSRKETPFNHFDTLDEICQFLRLRDKLALSATNKLTAYMVDEHLKAQRKEQGLPRVHDKNERQAVKYYLCRNLRVVKLPTIFGKEESTHYNFLRGKNIVKIDAGKNFTVFIDHKRTALYTKTAWLTPKYHPHIKHQKVNNIKKAFGKGCRMFILHQDGKVESIMMSESEDKIGESQVLKWSEQVSVVDMTVSYTFAVFLLGCVKITDIKKKIFQEEVEDAPNDGFMKIMFLNLGNARYTLIKYPYETVKSFCVGNNTAYFVTPRNEILQCDLLGLNEGQTEVGLQAIPHLANKSIIKVWSGFHYFVALSRREYVLDKWDNAKVLEWLRQQDFSEFANIMRTEKITGKRLLEMDRRYMADVLGITNTNLQQKMLMSIQKHQEVSYLGDQLYGWGRNDTGQLATNQMQHAQKPVKIKMPQFSPTQHIEDISCGWFNTILTSSAGRTWISGKEPQKQKQKQEDISDEELKKDIDRERKRRKRSEVAQNSDEEETTEEPTKRKKDKKKPSHEENPKKESKPQKHGDKRKQQKQEKYEQPSQWFEYNNTKVFAVDSVKDLMFISQLAYKEDDVKKKVRTAKAAIDKVLWDPNLDKSQYVVGYFDKYMGTLEMTIENYRKSEVKEHRLTYLKKRDTVVWHRENKIDLL